MAGPLPGLLLSSLYSHMVLFVELGRELPFIRSVPHAEGQNWQGLDILKSNIIFPVNPGEGRYWEKAERQKEQQGWQS